MSAEFRELMEGWLARNASADQELQDFVRAISEPIEHRNSHRSNSKAHKQGKS